MLSVVSLLLVLVLLGLPLLRGRPKPAAGEAA
jgi:hypothetical protein